MIEIAICSGRRFLNGCSRGGVTQPAATRRSARISWLVLSPFLALAFLASCPANPADTSPPPPAPAPATAPPPVASPESEGWKPLFNGRDLAGWQVANISGHGPVTATNGTLVLGVGNPMTGVKRLAAPASVDYEISLEAKRLAGEDFFCGLTFPIGTNHCSLIVGGWGGGVVGLSSLNGYDASENETTTFQEFKSGPWYRVRLRVTAARVEAWIDAKRVVNVDIREHRISVRSGDIEECQPFGLANYMTSTAFRDLRFRQLDEAEIQKPTKEAGN
jgi:hypothetical protein